MRLFLAINPPTEVRREVFAATAALRTAAPQLAWVGDAQLHLTLKFIGEQPAERIDNLRDAMASIARHHRELVMTVGGVGAFPNFRRARVVWMGVNPDPRLELLHHDVEVECEKLGFDVEGRPFRPHLTLARVKHAPTEEQLRALSRRAKATTYAADFVVRAFDLMRSEQSPTGSVYTTLVSAALRSD